VKNRGFGFNVVHVVIVADESGTADFHEMVLRLRQDYLAQVRAEGRDADAEAGRLSLDEVRAHIAGVVLPRLISSGAVERLSALLRPFANRDDAHFFLARTR